MFRKWFKSKMVVRCPKCNGKIKFFDVYTYIPHMMQIMVGNFPPIECLPTIHVFCRQCKQVYDVTKTQ